MSQFNPNYNDSEHPDIAHANDDPRGRIWQHRRLFKGGVAEVDYDLEPFRVFRDNEKGGSKSVPKDDFEAARAANRAHAARSVLF